MVGRCDRNQHCSQAGGREFEVATYQRFNLSVDLLDAFSKMPGIAVVKIGVRNERGRLKTANAYGPPQQKATTWFTSL